MSLFSNPEGSSKPIENSINLTSESSTVDIGIEDFDALNDTLIVIQNSTFTKDYTINGRVITKNSGTWDAGTVFNFIVFK